MTVESERIKSIRRRWTDERKIAGRDVEWLLAEADRAETRRAADALRNATRPHGMGGLIDDLFGKR